MILTENNYIHQLMGRCRNLVLDIQALSARVAKRGTTWSCSGVYKIRAPTNTTVFTRVSDLAEILTII